MSSEPQNPYSGLPETAFWKTAVATKTPQQMSGLWDPKFPVEPAAAVATFGSCFAQNFGKALRARGFNWFITEPAPAGLPDTMKAMFNYDLFSCRTGNIYTTSLLHQWVNWAVGEQQPPDERWVVGGRTYDPFRPRIEPDGFDTADEMLESRRQAIAAFRQAIERSNIFVFTLGLTESWFNAAQGHEYPMCPGTAAGTFDPTAHVFKNQEFEFIRSHLEAAVAKMRAINPALSVLLTVSPVPLTATASGRHVVVATMESKSVLRAVAGQTARGDDNIDYFPSYEIINSPVFKGQFFEPNQRSVKKDGVDFVMSTFFGAQESKFGVSAIEKPATPERSSSNKPTADEALAEAVCEEELLGAFGGGQ